MVGAELARWVLVSHVGVTLMLVGLIWTIQVVHYPLFASVGRASFERFHAGHTGRISVLVIPLMLTEVATGALLLMSPPASLSWSSLWLGAILLAVVWVSTFALHVPQHEALSKGLDLDTCRAMVRTNWIRTLAWTGRGALGMVWFEQALMRAS